MRLIRAAGPTAIFGRAGTPSKQAHRKCSAASSAISCWVCPRAINGAAMEFGLSESQEFLKDSARKFFAGECPSAEMRRLMETDTAYDAALWSKITEQGYTGIIFPEAYGGVGLGKFDIMLLMEEAGRGGVAAPLFSTVAPARA